MWQTVYLEARGSDPLEFVHFTPHADLAGVGVDVRLLDPASRVLTLRLAFTNRAGGPVVTHQIARGLRNAHLDVPLLALGFRLQAVPIARGVSGLLLRSGLDLQPWVAFNAHEWSRS